MTTTRRRRPSKSSGPRPDPVGVVQTIRVARSRHNWRPGAFDVLVGKRIPFPERGGPAPAYPLTGVLRDVEEDEQTIKLTFQQVTRESMGPTE